MNKPKNTDPLHRYYVHATEQQLYASGVDYATSVEYVTENNMFKIYPFYRHATEWIVNETLEWAEKFSAKTSIELVELFGRDVVRNEEYAVYVTHACDRRIYTPEIREEFEAIMKKLDARSLALVKLKTTLI